MIIHNQGGEEKGVYSCEACCNLEDDPVQLSGLKVAEKLRITGSNNVMYSMGADTQFRLLREEAIKWVKDPDVIDPLTRKWIKHFFNITKEFL